MTYLAESSGRKPGSKEWFVEIDRRFLRTAYYAHADGIPFGRFLTPEVASGRRVLEVGCGMGTHAALLIQAGAIYTGIDLTQPAVEMTKRRLDLFELGGDALGADAEDLPFESASFDTVWSWGVIHHSASFERCFSEITRVLRPGERILLMVYHRPSLFYALYCGLARGIIRGELRHRSLEEIYLDQIDGAYVRRFHRRELATLFATNYVSIEIDAVGQKEEMFPLPRSRLKQRLVGWTPDWFASAIFSRLGHMVVNQAERRA